MHTRLLLAVSGALLLPIVAAQPQSPDAVRIPRVSDPPPMEAFLGAIVDNGAAGAATTSLGLRIDVFRQRKPGDGSPVSRPTRAYLSYDDEHLYVVFVCEDDPRAVRAHMARREAIDQDDQVWLYLDTFHDRQRAYVFAANPLGVQLDGIIAEGQGSDFGFDAVWESEGRLTPNGYVVRFSIPFKSLRFQRRAQQTWGIALGRVIRRFNEEAYWPYITERIEGFVPQFGTAQGLADISPGRNLQVIAYNTVARAREFDDDLLTGPGFVTQDDWRGGIDGKAVLRDAVTLDMALNPDFSQVESDDPQVTINERFEVFFPEKRPFFLENAGYFQTPTNLFHSRRIADPQGGARLTGKLGGWTVGALAIDDRAPGRNVDVDDPRFGERALTGVASLRREFGRGSSVGALVTSRDLGPEWNRVGSLHGRLRLGSNWVVEGQAMRSFSGSEDGGLAPGAGYLAELSHDGRSLELDLRYTDFDPAFRSDLGFLRRMDLRRADVTVQPTWRTGGYILQTFGANLAGLVNWDHAGRLQDWEVEGGFEFELARGTDIQIERAEVMELFDGREFRQGSNSVEVDTEWWSWLGLNAEYTWGTEPNFDPADGLEPFLGRQLEAEFGFALRPGPRLRFEQKYIYSRLTAHENAALVGVAPGTRIFDNHLLRSRLNYQFTRALSLRLIVDYETVAADTTLIDEDGNEKQLTADVLLTYLVHPGTAVYLGFTDEYENFIVEDEPAPRIRRVGRLRTSEGRQVFVKVTYLFRF